MVSQADNQAPPVGEIFRLIPQVMRAVGAIGKGRQNQAQNYRFRGIDDVYNAIHGPLADAGVFVVPQVMDVKRDERERMGRDGKPSGVMFYVTLTVKHTFYAPDGSSIEATTVGEAMDTGDKASNKAMSAAMKYAIIEVFAIPTERDNDTENDSPEVTARRPNNGNGHVNGAGPLSDPEKFDIQLGEALEARGFDRAGWARVRAKACASKKVKSLADLTPEQRTALLAAVNAGKFDSMKETVTA